MNEDGSIREMLTKKDFSQRERLTRKDRSPRKQVLNGKGSKRKRNLTKRGFGKKRDLNQHGIWVSHDLGERILKTPFERDSIDRASRLTPDTSRSLSEQEESVSAHLLTTLTLHDGREVTFSGRYFRQGRMVRFIPDPVPGLRNEIELFDFDQHLRYRIFPDDRIYFQMEIGRSRLEKAVREAWVSPPGGWREERIYLREIDSGGAAAELYLLIQERPVERTRFVTDYALLWIGKQEQVPLQIVFTDPQGHPIRVQFRDLTVGPLDPSLFRPPADFSRLHPF